MKQIPNPGIIFVRWNLDRIRLMKHSLRADRRSIRWTHFIQSSWIMIVGFWSGGSWWEQVTRRCLRSMGIDRNWQHDLRAFPASTFSVSSVIESNAVHYHLILTMFYKMVSRCLFSNQNYCIIITCYKWSSTCLRISMRIIGPLMLILANTLIFSVAYIFFSKLLPNVAGESHTLYWLHALIGAFLLVNVTFNYISCAFTSPGSPESCLDPSKYFGQISSVIDNRIITQIRNRLDLVPGVSYRYCKYCSCIKPPRSHHCRWLNRPFGHRIRFN